MENNPRIIVTGAAGFIGSYMAGYLNRHGYNNLILVDEFSSEEKKPNYIGKEKYACIERSELFAWLETGVKVDFIFHLGARTDTTEFNYAIHEQLNVNYSKLVWDYCARHHIPLVYASSAATYGSGEFGYNDDHAIVEKLKPLNAYGVSKNEFDKWVLWQAQHPPFWAGLKFFNVYGPNEYHKARMASVIFHAFDQIQRTGKVKLFRSHNPLYKDGEQLRDFIYVKDVARVMLWMMKRITEGAGFNSGLYNVGTGIARNFNDLAAAIFKGLDVRPQIEYIDTPADIRDKYQYFTEANMDKLRQAGYAESFSSLEEGINHYLKEFLIPHEFY